jgi:hypothetical protein
VNWEFGSFGLAMVFVGIKDPSKLEDLLAYLNQATR